MGKNLSVTPDSVEIDNLGGVSLHIANFTTTPANTGERAFYSSSLNAIVGYWFNPDNAPATASLNAIDVSLIGVDNNQFRFTGSSTGRTGKLYILSLS